MKQSAFSEAGASKPIVIHSFQGFQPIIFIFPSTSYMAIHIHPIMIKIIG
ncbi:MAG: hypothetical protein NTW49_01275 [Bacteroidia bacterium]|nr:hypothetical protein [Bacteroidia bacterium]